MSIDSRSDIELASEGAGEREAARRRLQARRDFVSHMVAYIVVNVALVAVWALTDTGYFWPAWVIVMWGAGLVLHGWNVFLNRSVTEADVDAELQHHDR